MSTQAKIVSAMMYWVAVVGIISCLLYMGGVL